MCVWCVYACVGIPVPYHTCRSHSNPLGSEVFPSTIGSRVGIQISRLAQAFSALFLAKFIKQIPAINNVYISDPFVFEPFELHKSAYLKAYRVQHKTVGPPCLLSFYSVSYVIHISPFLWQSHYLLPVLSNWNYIIWGLSCCHFITGSIISAFHSSKSYSDNDHCDCFYICYIIPLPTSSKTYFTHNKI